MIDMQLQQQYQWNDDQFFIPAGYRIFKIKPSILANKTIQNRSLIYASDAMTIQDLVNIFLQDYKIVPQQYGEDMVVGFHMDGMGKLAMEISIFQIKNQLHNLKIKVLEFTPFLMDRKTFHHECYATLRITPHPLSKQIQANQNKVEFCLDFWQFQEVEYALFNASNELGQQLAKFLKSKQRIYGKDLSLFAYKIVCQGCGEELAPKTQVFMLRHYSLQVTFKQLKQSNKKPFLHDVLINLIEGVDNVVRTVSFGSIVRKKVRTVLEESRLAIDNIECFGLKILNTILKPIDFLSKLQMQLGVMSKVTINAFLVQQSQLFYSIQPLFRDISFNISEITNTLKSQQVRKHKEQMLNKIYVRREERINSSPLPIHKSNIFIDPILGYTSELYYRQLNQYLRQTNFGMVSQEDYMKYEYKFSFALINSLFKLPNFRGRVYRGVQFSDVKSKKGNIISFNSFTSTSYNRERAQKFGKRTFYIIESLTGKDVSNYSYFRDQQEVLFMPYTYFYVTSVEIDIDSEHGMIIIWLQEIPVPRKIDSNLLFWVDDKLEESSQIYKVLLYKMPNIKTQIIQLTSNELLNIWVNKFGYILKKKSKISLITNMLRGEQTDAGLTTISILSKHVQGLNTFIYILNLIKTMQLLQQRGIKLSSSLQIGNKKTDVVQFIQTKVLDKSQMVSQQCQLI